MITVKRFCCCCDLQLGTQVVALLGIIFGISIIIIKAFTFHQNPTDRGIIASEIFLINLQLMTSVVLFIGVTQRKPSCVLFWLIGHMIGIVLTVILTIIAFGLLTTQGALVFAIALLNVMILILLLSYYIWICVYSFYVQLKEDFNQTASNV